MAKEPNKADDFSSFDEMDLETELEGAHNGETPESTAPKDPKAAPTNSEAPTDKPKDESDLSNFFADLSQLKKDVPDEGGSSGAEATASQRLQKPTHLLSFSLKYWLLGLNLGGFFKKLLKYSFLLLIVLGLVYGGYYLFKSRILTDLWQTTGDKIANIKLLDFKEPFIEPEAEAIDNRISIDYDRRPGYEDEFSEFTTDKDGTWHIQIGVCSTTQCVNNIKQLLSRNSVPNELYLITKKTIGARFSKLYNADYYQYWADARIASEKINQNNSYGLKSYVEPSDNGYRLVFGSFPVETYGIKDYVAAVKAELSKILSEVLFEVSYEVKQSAVSKIYLGPFAARDSAQNLLDKLQTKRGFQQALLTRR